MGHYYLEGGGNVSTIDALAIVLFILMVLVGGKQGALAGLSIWINFFLLYIGIILIALQVPPVPVAAGVGVLILAITIFMGEDDLNTTVNALLSALIVAALLLVLIVILEYFAQVQGFSVEDSDDLEGMSLTVGISFLAINMAAAFLATLGAIAEAAMAVSSGLIEVLKNHPNLSDQRLFASGMTIGKQIIGTTLNTLFFGFVGGLLALFIWFMNLDYSIGMILNNKIFGNEALLVLLSFLAVIMTVPTTTAVVIYRRRHPGMYKQN